MTVGRAVMYSSVVAHALHATARHSREVKVTIDVCGMFPSTRTRVMGSGYNCYSKFQHEGGGHSFQRRETGTGQNADVGMIYRHRTGYVLDTRT